MHINFFLTGDLARTAHEACRSSFSDNYNVQEFITLVGKYHLLQLISKSHKFSNENLLFTW